MYKNNCFVVSVNIHFCQRQTKCIDDQDKFESVKDTDNEFAECQTPRKKLQSSGISPVSLHAFMKKAQKVQVDCLNNSEPDSYDKNDMQKKMPWLGCTRQCKKNQKHHHIRNESKFLMVPDKWSRMYCSEYFNVLEYFV